MTPDELMKSNCEKMASLSDETVESEHIGFVGGLPVGGHGFY